MKNKNNSERQCSPTHAGEPNNNEIRIEDTEPNVSGVASCSASDFVKGSVGDETYHCEGCGTMLTENGKQVSKYHYLVRGDNEIHHFCSSECGGIFSGLKSMT